MSRTDIGSDATGEALTIRVMKAKTWFLQRSMIRIKWVLAWSLHKRGHDLTRIEEHSLPCSFGDHTVQVQVPTFSCGAHWLIYCISSLKFCQWRNFRTVYLDRYRAFNINFWAPPTRTIGMSRQLTHMQIVNPNQRVDGESGFDWDLFLTFEYHLQQQSLDEPISNGSLARSVSPPSIRKSFVLAATMGIDIV